MKVSHVLRAAARRTCVFGLVVLFFSPITPPLRAGGLPAGAIREYQPAPDEFAGLGKAVMELLRSGDAARFATNLAATTDDWKSILSTNLAAKGEDQLQRAQARADHERQQVESSAKAVLEKAATLHLDFAKGDWSPRVIMPKQFAMTHYPTLQAENEYLPSAQMVEIILDSGPAGGGSTNGGFKIAVRGMVKFNGGWRCNDGIQWEAFPGNVGDEQTRRELAIAGKVAAREPISGQDDPALLKLGETLVRFIRERDPAIYEKDAFVTTDLLWALYEKSGPPGHSRAELDDVLNARLKEQAEVARATVKQLEDAKVDLKNADIQITEAAVARARSAGAAGSLDGLTGIDFELKLAVKSDGKAGNGASLTGEYILAANQLMRFESGWRVADNLHWSKLPDGILDQAVVATNQFENYVAGHGTLPLHSIAPEIEFITLNGEKKMKLSDLKGKVVVLDFWATWCGPCQAPMAELQKLPAAHPDWKDRVVIVPVSIDDTLKIVRKHLDDRGWTNTFNVWADTGGFGSKPAAAFRVTGVPTTYIIDAEGKISTAGHAGGTEIVDPVNELLKK